MKFSDVEWQHIKEVANNALELFRPPPDVNLAQWAIKHFKLSAESSYSEGDWEPYPFQIGIMILAGDWRCEELAIKKSARVGYTKILVACIMYNAHHHRRNQALWQPTAGDRDEFAKTEIDTALRDVQCMKEIMSGKREDDTLKIKTFSACVLYLRGGTSAGEYRRISPDVCYQDEIDKFDRDIQGEGDSYSLTRKRLEGATFPKHIIGSTPKTKNLSHIDTQFQSADVRLYFFIKCQNKSCGKEHRLLPPTTTESAGGLRWESGRPETVKHYCPHCEHPLTRAKFLKIYKHGRWKSDDESMWFDEQAEEMRSTETGEVLPMPKSIGMHVWAAYSPQATWEGIADEFDKALRALERGRTEKMKACVNTTLGEVYEDQVDQADPEKLKKLVDEQLHMRVMPSWAPVLVCGVDIQDDRIECVAWAFGRGEEMAAIDYHVIRGDPGEVDIWKELDGYLLSKFQTHHGRAKGFDAVGIDSGGHFTHQVYGFCRQRSRRRVFATKGESQRGKPIFSQVTWRDVNGRGGVLKQGVRLYHIGTDTAKDLLHTKFGLKGSGPGRVHFVPGLGDSFYEQLTAEQRILRKTSTGEDYVWDKVDPRNEVLDCTVMSLFCASYLNLDKWTERMWQQKEAAVLAQPMFTGQVVKPPENLSDSQSESQLQPPPTLPAKLPGTANERRRPKRRSRIASDRWLARK